MFTGARVQNVALKLSALLAAIVREIGSPLECSLVIGKLADINVNELRSMNRKSNRNPRCGLDRLRAISHLWARCPWRPADWRWQVACQFATDPAVATLPDDATIRQAAYAIAYQRVVSAKKRFRNSASGKHHAIRTAIELNRRADLATTELMARILANESRRQLARHFKTTIATIGAFEKLFFDVRPMLKHAGWIRHVALRPYLRPDGSVGDLQGLWLTSAYSLGLPTLELLLNALPPHLRKHATLADYFDPLNQGPPELRMFIALKCCRPTDIRNPAILHAMLRINSRNEQLCAESMAVAPEESIDLDCGRAVDAALANIVAARRENEVEAVAADVMKKEVQKPRRRHVRRVA